MAIKKHELEKMNSLLESGVNISEISKRYKQYDYWEIYWSVNDYSLMGKKRMITNRLKKLNNVPKKEDRKELIEEIQQQVNEIYSLFKKNGKKLIEINKVLNS